MSKPEFAMSMFASRADLYKAKAEYFEKALTELRDEMLRAQDAASSPPAYLDENEYGYYNGKEFAYDEAVCALNKLL